MSTPGSCRSGPAQYVTGPVTTTSARTARLLALAALLLVLAACGHPTQRRTMTIGPVDGSPGFVPQTVTVDKENQVVINVTNSTNATHGFAIEGYQRVRVLDPGVSEEVEFRAGRAGTFKIYCQLHPKHQTATLVVR